MAQIVVITHNGQLPKFGGKRLGYVVLGEGRIVVSVVPQSLRAILFPASVPAPPKTRVVTEVQICYGEVACPECATLHYVDPGPVCCQHCGTTFTAVRKR